MGQFHPEVPDDVHLAESLEATFLATWRAQEENIWELNLTHFVLSPAYPEATQSPNRTRSSSGNRWTKW